MRPLHGRREYFPNSHFHSEGPYQRHQDAGPKADADVKLNPGKGFIMNVVRSFNNWLSYRRALADLGRLDSRMLQDMGISRGQIPALARSSDR